MKIIVKNKNFNIDTWLENKLMDIGVYDKDSFINLSQSCIEDYRNYDNMDKGLELLVASTKIGLLVDPDVDGFSSSAIIYEYCNRINKPVKEVFFHQGKQHGLSDVYEDVLNTDIDLLIIPDAGSNDYEYHTLLKNKEINVLVLDHHECEKYSENAVVINNQLSNDVSNKNLCGVGVAYKFIQYCDEKYNAGYDDLLDLVALGNISDMMDISEDETRYLCIEGLKNINNRFFKAMISKFVNGSINMKSIAWNVTPKINAIIRNGTFEDKKLLFEAFINPTKKIEVIKKGKKSKINMSTYIVDICEKIKRGQDKETKDGVQTFINKGKIDTEKKAIVITVENEINKGITGLVANRLCGEYKRPIIVLHKKENDIYGGSVRSPKGFANNDSFKDYLHSTGLIALGEGHGNAFGVEIKKENIKPLCETMERDFENVTCEENVMVDYEINAMDLCTSHIEEVSQYKYLWGQGLEEPKFIIRDVEVESDYISMMFNKTILAFSYSGIYYNKKYCSKVFREDLGYESEKNIKTKCDIVATFDVEEYKGNSYYKVIIEKLIKH